MAAGMDMDGTDIAETGVRIVLPSDTAADRES